MGLTNRKKSGATFGGTKLNVPGLGIFTVKNSPADKVMVKGMIDNPQRRPTPTPTKQVQPTPTPTPSITPTTTPTPSITPTTTPTPSVTQTNTPTPTLTPTPTTSTICLLAQENLDKILTEMGDSIVISCP